MSKSPCKRVEELIDHIVANPQADPPAYLQIPAFERAELAEHAKVCPICVSLIDGLEYPEDEGLAEDILNQIIDFRFVEYPEPGDEPADTTEDAVEQDGSNQAADPTDRGYENVRTLSGGKPKPS